MDIQILIAEKSISIWDWIKYLNTVKNQPEILKKTKG